MFKWQVVLISICNSDSGDKKFGPAVIIYGQMDLKLPRVAILSHGLWVGMHLYQGKGRASLQLSREKAIDRFPEFNLGEGRDHGARGLAS